MTASVGPGRHRPFGLGRTPRCAREPATPPASPIVNLNKPQNATILDGQAVGTVRDDDPALPTPPSISINDPRVEEGADGVVEAEFTVRLSRPVDDVVAVDFQTSSDTASVGSDYEARSGTLAFEPGDTSRPIKVCLKGDTRAEDDERFTVTLSNPVGAVLADAGGTATIVDDDTPTLPVSSERVVEGNDGTTDAVFTVRLSPAARRGVTVQFTMRGDTATADRSQSERRTEVDFRGTRGGLAFGPGETTRMIRVSILGDTRAELNETFQVVLAGAENAAIGQGVGIGTIVDDDEPLVSIDDATTREIDQSDLATGFTVTLSRPAERDVSVDYAIGGAAAARVDSRTLSGTLIIPEGEREGGVLVRVMPDSRCDGDDTFTVTLRDARNAEIADGVGIGTIRSADTPSLSIGDATVREADDGAREAVFTVTLSARTRCTVTVEYATNSDGARAGTDFRAASGTLTFPPDVTTRRISVRVIADDQPEPDERFIVALRNPRNATIADGRGTGTIRDDDGFQPTRTALERDAAAGARELRVKDTNGFRPNDRVRINPRGSNEELVRVERVEERQGVLRLEQRLTFAHRVGELVVEEPE